MSRRYAQAVVPVPDPVAQAPAVLLEPGGATGPAGAAGAAVGPGAAAAGGGAPARFLWRGRVYLVRSVLAHWVEVGAWWRSVDRVPGPGPGVAAERVVWRVEAAAGRSDPPGVYDLCLDRATGAWSLARALD